MSTLTTPSLLERPIQAFQRKAIDLGEKRAEKIFGKLAPVSWAHR